MNTLEKVVAGIIALIAIYLFVFNADNTSKVIMSFASGGSELIATLQGRGFFGAGVPQLRL